MDLSEVVFGIEEGKFRVVGWDNSSKEYFYLEDKKGRKIEDYESFNEARAIARAKKQQSGIAKDYFVVNGKGDFVYSSKKNK